jgi:hypothetical protein
VPTTGERFLLLLLAVAGPAHAEVTIPVIGQPSPFYGAAGKGVKVEAQADPLEVTPEETLTFTLRVRGLVNPAEVQRPDLSAIDAFARDFQIEDGPTPDSEPEGTRVFHYRLRPRRPTVTVIPALSFPYYDPSLPQPPDKPDFPFRKARTEPITIRVKKVVEPPPAIVPLEVPDFASEPARSVSVDWPAWVWWAAAAIPPVLALGWCGVWRLLNPGGARLARRRRSRAARAALKTLHSMTRHPPADPGTVVWCVAAYLAERYELPGLFRTPDDLTRRLREAGADPATVTECATFLNAADIARFAPAPEQTGDALIADAESLVRRLEGEA